MRPTVVPFALAILMLLPGCLDAADDPAAALRLGLQRALEGIDVIGFGCIAPADQARRSTG